MYLYLDFFDLGDLIEILIDVLSFGVPSKQKRVTQKRVKLLKKQKEFDYIHERFGLDVYSDPRIRDYISSYSIERILPDEKRRMTFLENFEKKCEKVFWR